MEFSVNRELEEVDIAVRLALGAAEGGRSAGKITKLRLSHHKLARALAMGHTQAEASLLTGYSISRISSLTSDPAFAELLAHYTEKLEEVYVNFNERMADFAIDVLDELQERLETNPNAISTKDLNELIKTTADRGGHSPVHKTESKTITISATELERIKQEVETKQNGRIRRINQAEETARVHTLLTAKDRSESQDNKEPALCLNDNRPTSVIAEEAPIEGGKGEGDSV